MISLVTSRIISAMICQPRIKKKAESPGRPSPNLPMRLRTQRQGTTVTLPSLHPFPPAPENLIQPITYLPIRIIDKQRNGEYGSARLTVLEAPSIEGVPSLMT